MRDRLTAGPVTLNHVIQVRILVPQEEKFQFDVFAPFGSVFVFKGRYIFIDR